MARGRSLASGLVLGVAGYSAYIFWRKKYELEQLVNSVGLQHLLAAGSTHPSRDFRVREHFAATQREADRLLKDALPRLHEQLDILIDVNGFKLKMKDEGQMSDMARWHELMVLTLARLLTAQYALALTVLQLRVKLNIVARHHLLEFAANQDPEALNNRRDWLDRCASHTSVGAERTLSNLTKRRFLSMDHLLSEGFQPLAAAVIECVRSHILATAERLSMVKLAERLCAAQALAMVSPVRTALEAALSGATEEETTAEEKEPAASTAFPYNGSSNNSSGGGGGSTKRSLVSADSTKRNLISADSSWGDVSGGGGSSDNSALSPSSVVSSFLHEELDSHGVIATGDQLHGLITEAKFVLGSAAFRFTVTDLLTSGFGALATELQVHIGTDGGGAGAAHPRRRSLPLAKLLAQFHKLSAATLSPSEPFVEALLATPSLDEFCWMAYSGD